MNFAVIIQGPQSVNPNDLLATLPGQNVHVHVISDGQVTIEFTE